MSPPPPPVIRDDEASVRSEWASEDIVLEAGTPLWPAREQSHEPEDAIARAAAERIADETGMPSTPELVELLSEGIRAVLWVLFEYVPASGPQPGQLSARAGLARLRARDVATPSGRRTSGVVEKLLEWEVTGVVERAALLSVLVVGRDSWESPDGFGASAVWATGSLDGTPLLVTDRAACGWAVASDRLLGGDTSRRRRDAVIRAVMRHRRSRRTAGASPTR